MEQIEQLIGIRDAAEKRLEAARAALERSPDAKLVASLSLLIDDLKQSFGSAEETSQPPVAASVEQPAVVEETVDEVIEPEASSEDFSLEDSLEAELLKVDN